MKTDHGSLYRSSESVIPSDGLPVGRIGKDFYPPGRRIHGHPEGLFHLCGDVIATDGFEYLLRLVDGRRVLVHVEWFVELKTGAKPTNKPKAPTGQRLPRVKKEVDITDLLGSIEDL